MDRLDMTHLTRFTIGLVLCTLLVIAPAWAQAPGERELKTEEKEAAVVLEEIVVEGAPYVTPVTPVNTRYGTQHNLVTEEQIRDQSALDLQSALRNVPGVTFQSRNLMGSQSGHSLYIRGRGASHPGSDLTVLFDGVPRFGALFGQMLGDGIALPTIGGIEIFKSPQPSEFGSGYASVNVLPKYLKEEGRELSLDAGGGSFNTFTQSLSGGLKKGAFDAYLSQSWTSTDGHRDHSRAQQQNYYINTGYHINKHWNARLLVDRVESQTVAPMPDMIPTATNGVMWPMAERFDTETLLATLTLTHQYGHAGGFMKAYMNDTDFDLLQELTDGKRYAGGTDGLWSRQSMYLYGMRAKEKLRLWAGGETVLGIDLDRTELKNTQRTYSGLAVAGINGGRAERTWDFPNITLVSPYAAVSQVFGLAGGARIIPSVGFRYFHHSEFKGETALHAGLVIGYGATELNIHYARGVNYPTPVVLMNMVLTSSPLVNPRQYWEKIKPETVDHYEVALSHTWSQKATLGATVFYDKGSDRFQAYMFGPIPVRFNDPIGKYEISGLELTGTFTPLKMLDFFAGATLMAAKARGSDNLERNHMPYTPGFQFQAGMDWSFLDRFRLRLDMQHLKDVYAGTNVRSGTFNYVELKDTHRLKDFTLFNGRLSYRFAYRPWYMENAEVHVAVNNITHEHYEYAKGYGMPGTTVFAGLGVKFR